MDNGHIVGTWSLVSVEARSNQDEELLPYGENPAGLLVYTASGDMAVTLMRTGRPKFASGDPMSGTAEEIEQAFTGFDAYAGTYQVDAEQGAVTHQIEVGRFPNWEDTAQLRYFRLARNQLILSTPPIAALGREWILDVVWRRRA